MSKIKFVNFMLGNPPKFSWRRTELPLIVKIKPHLQAKGEVKDVFKNTSNNFIETPEIQIKILNTEGFQRDADHEWILIKTKKIPSIQCSQQILGFGVEIKAVVLHEAHMEEVKLEGSSTQINIQHAYFDDLKFGENTDSLEGRPLHLLALLYLDLEDPIYINAFLSPGVYVQKRILTSVAKLFEIPQNTTLKHYEWFKPAYLNTPFYESKDQNSNIYQFLTTVYSTRKKYNPFFMAVQFPQIFKIYYDGREFSDISCLIRFYFEQRKMESQRLSMVIYLRASDITRTCELCQLYGFPNNPRVQLINEANMIPTSFIIAKPSQIQMEYTCFYNRQQNKKLQVDYTQLDHDPRKRVLTSKILKLKTGMTI